MRIKTLAKIKELGTCPRNGSRNGSASGLKRFLTRYPSVSSAYVINGTVNDQTSFGKCRIHYLSFDRFEENFHE